jgi:hypothetical protein
MWSQMHLHQRRSLRCFCHATILVILFAGTAAHALPKGGASSGQCQEKFDAGRLALTLNASDTVKKWSSQNAKAQGRPLTPQCRHEKHPPGKRLNERFRFDGCAA